MAQLILIRHGESVWNRDNRFTGWADVDLTEAGLEQMHGAGVLLRKERLMIDTAYTSLLTRCIRSQWALLEGMERVWVPVACDWRLNERHYGALTGLSKAAAAQTYGAGAVHRWRRSYDAIPPLGEGDGDGYPILDERYDQLSAEEIPRGESLAQVVNRVQPLWDQSIADALRSGKKAIVTGHGNSLRALMKIIEGISDQNIVALEIPNAVPVVYEFDAFLRPVGRVMLGTSTTAPSEIL
jgi:2,3-bisphosphoglycerate-dependent phosphoglycerate mutase